MKHKHIMSFIFFFIIINVIFYDGGALRITTFTVVNDCGFTVWPSISGDFYNLNTSGFELTKGTSRSFEVDPYLGESISIWGRTGCTFNGSGSGSCATGDCGTGQMDCNGTTLPSPPVTIAYFNTDLDTESNLLLTYNVSIINGYNLPMTIEPAVGGIDHCLKTGCASDLNQRCPPELKLMGGEGCKTGCQVYPSQYECCKFGTSDYDHARSTCNTTVYGQLFHLACPKSVTYQYDEHDNTHSCNVRDYTIRFCPSADTFSTIKLGGQLKYNDQLVSVGGNFTLGFFNELDNTYLGIWYTNDVQSRKVWVANRNKPISDFDALSIDSNMGNLIITSGGKALMNITDVQAGQNPNVTATLEDNGNFRLINEIDKRVLWQSFDHPTNVLLPGMKLGYDMETGQNWTLTSWVSDENPNLGPFTLSWEAMGETSQRLMIQRRGQPYWTSGNLKDQSFMDFFSFHDNKLLSTYSNKERYFSYMIEDTEYEDGDAPSYMWILTPKGRIDVGTIVDAGNVADSRNLDFCYGFYRFDPGCMNVSSLTQCRRKIDRFINRNGDFSLYGTSKFIDMENDTSVSISDCFLKCWNDCNCVGFSNGSTDGTGCIFWRGRNSFADNPLQNSTWTYVIYSPNLSTGKKTKSTSGMTIIIVIGTIIPLIFLRLGLLWLLKKRDQRQEEEERRKRDEYLLELTSSESFKDVRYLESNGGKGTDLLIFSYPSIIAATNNFSVANKLGQGGFGPVYKGQLSDGQEIAIKRLSSTSGQGLVEFKNELILIAKLQHTNLVRVLGCCIHRDEKMLIYEYMPNKSLDFFLFDDNKKVELDWPKRFNIIEGIAEGLLYLHKHSRMRVIHRDLKAQNILLDECMKPKISDFGMARMFKQNETQAMTNRVVGTFGYMSPEYIMEGTFSIKSDIFSFGVLILEIVSGRKNSSFVHHDRTYNLIGYAWELWQQGNTLELEDTTLGDTCVVQQFLRTVHVALLCVQESATDRPTTSDMISMLLNDTAPLPAPNKPAFFISRAERNPTPEECKQQNSSNMTITIMEGR